MSLSPSPSYRTLRAQRRPPPRPGGVTRDARQGDLLRAGRAQERLQELLRFCVGRLLERDSQVPQPRLDRELDLPVGIEHAVLSRAERLLLCHLLVEDAVAIDADFDVARL